MRLTDGAASAEPNFRAALVERMKTTINATLRKLKDFGGVEEVMLTEFTVQLESSLQPISDRCIPLKSSNNTVTTVHRT